MPMTMVTGSMWRPSPQGDAQSPRPLCPARRSASHRGRGQGQQGQESLGTATLVPRRLRVGCRGRVHISWSMLTHSPASTHPCSHPDSSPQPRAHPPIPLAQNSKDAAGGWTGCPSHALPQKQWAPTQPRGRGSFLKAETGTGTGSLERGQNWAGHKTQGVQGGQEIPLG